MNRTVYVPCICTCVLQSHTKDGREGGMRFYDFSEHAQRGQSVHSESGAWKARVIGFLERSQRGWSVRSKVTACAVRSEQAQRSRRVRT